MRTNGMVTGNQELSVKSKYEAVAFDHEHETAGPACKAARLNADLMLVVGRRVERFIMFLDSDEVFTASDLSLDARSETRECEEGVYQEMAA